LVNVAKALKCFPTGKVYGAVGNHDLGWGERMDSLLSQPLGLMVASEVYHNLSDTPIMVHNGHLKVAVHVESFPYSRADEMLPRILASRRDPDANYHVGIVHAYGNPGESKEYFGEPTIGYDDLAGADFDYLLWGHDHGREETVKVGNVTHVRLGSLARAALDTDEQERPVSLAVLSFRQDGVKYKEVPVPVKPLEEAFVVADQGVRKVEKSEEMKEFFTKMEEAVEGVETSDPAEALRLLCSDDPKLLALAKELCGL
jgi:DNA repair exonuclease SbcCD nuclease subunit